MLRLLAPTLRIVPAPSIPTTFRVLGPVEAVRGDRSLELGGRRQRTLLAVLLVERGRRVPVDRLIEELWHGEPPPAAATTLRSYVSRLRTSLADGVAVGGDLDGYTLEVAPDAVDATVFERLVREGEAAVARRSVRRAQEQLEVALNLWRGRPFGELADDGMLRVEADRLEDLRLHALELRIEVELQLGRSAELLSELEVLVASHPYRETYWRQFMLALYRSGRQADALAAYHRARRVLSDELGLEPGEELRALELAILRQEVPAATPPEDRHNLPQPLTTFIGRGREIDEILASLRKHRLVALTGVGGVGKTRLAIEAARRTVPEFADGVVFVDLSPLTDPGLAAPQIAIALEMREEAGGAVMERLAERLREADLLLLLDNCEHLREAVADLVSRLLARSHRLRVLATSREPLAVPGELDFSVPPLELIEPDAPTEELEASESVALFLARAREGRRGIGGEAALRTAARICRELDGLPLAIELAAARSQAVTLDEMARHLRDRFRFLVAWRRLAPARHRTLEAALDWSFELLSADERLLLAELSVFAGGFTLPAVADVCTDRDDGLALERVERLVAASLVIAEEQAGEMRYRMLETVRQYAGRRLEAMGKADATRRRHALHFIALADEARVPIMRDEATTWTTRLAREQDNLRAALAWARDSSESELLVRTAEALWWFWWIHGDVTEGRGWLETALEHRAGAAPIHVVRALQGAAGLAWVAGDPDGAERLAHEGYELGRTIDEPEHTGGCLNVLGLVAQMRGDPVAARSFFEQARAQWLRLADEHPFRKTVLTTVAHNLASTALDLGDLHGARAGYEEALAISRADGDEDGIALCELFLGHVAMLEERWDDARTLLGRALRRYRTVGWHHYLVDCLDAIGFLAQAKGNAGEAATLLAGADALRDRIERHGLRKLRDRAWDAAAEELSASEFDAAVAEGRALSSEELLDRAQAIVS
jgi:predicted ATPase/DNA-binding SARP family transcriptional activator